MAKITKFKILCGIRKGEIVDHVIEGYNHYYYADSKSGKCFDALVPTSVSHIKALHLVKTAFTRAHDDHI